MAERSGLSTQLTFSDFLKTKDNATTNYSIKVMNSIKSYIKRQVLNLFPLPVLHYIKKIHYARKLQTFSIDQEPEMKVIPYLVRPGDHVIDIGANIGYYTKVLAELVGKEGCVYSVEPIPATFDILSSNIRRFKLNNVVPINCAISDSNTIVTLEVPFYTSGGENYYRSQIVNENEPERNMRRINAEAATLDAKFIDVSNKISFIKCDVEGHELSCLKGARNFFLNSQSAWFVEISGDPDQSQSSAKQVFDFFSQNRYSAWSLVNKKLKKWHRGEKSINYFFLQRDHIRTLRERASFLVE